MRAETIEEQPKVTIVIEPGSFSSLPKDGKETILSLVQHARVFCVCWEWEVISKAVKAKTHTLLRRLNDQLNERKGGWTSKNDTEADTIVTELNFGEETVKHLLQVATNAPLWADTINVLFCKWWWWWLELDTLYDHMCRKLSKVEAHSKAIMRFKKGIGILDGFFAGSVKNLGIFKYGLIEGTKKIETVLTAELRGKRPYFFFDNLNPDKNVHPTMEHSGHGQIVEYKYRTEEGGMAFGIKVKVFLSGKDLAVDILWDGQRIMTSAVKKFVDFVAVVTNFERRDDGLQNQ